MMYSTYTEDTCGALRSILMGDDVACTVNSSELARMCHMSEDTKQILLDKVLKRISLTQQFINSIH